MSRKLLLHIGCHKTGTSAIQRACVLNQDYLQKHGWYFAIGAEKVANWGNAFGFWKDETEVGFRITDKGLGAMTEALSSPGGNAILSAEDLFFLEEAEIRRFAAQIRPLFDEITLCAYLRRQDELAVSQKAQGAKTVQSALVFGTEPGALPELTPAVRSYLDFAGKLDAWKRAFEGAALSVREYNRPKLEDGDIVSDFFAQIGLRFKGDNEDVNASLGANEVQLLLALREHGMKQSDIARIRENDWIASHGTPPRPTRDEARRFYASFAKSNNRLEETIGTSFSFHDDFSRFPKRPQDTGYTAYERENLLTLAARLSRLASVDNAFVLRNIALQIEDQRPGMALKLLTMARELHPQGPMIRQAHERLSQQIAAKKAKA